MRMCERSRNVGALSITLAWLAAAGAAAQVHYQPQPRPIVTAENETWFQLGEPVVVDGITYHQAGARVYFDGNVMVRTGSYRGIPVYANTTLEPYSKVFVPLAGALMQPYERRRAGEVAGSTGSQAPSFPVTIAGEANPDDRIAPSLPGNAAPPTLVGGPRAEVSGPEISGIGALGARSASAARATAGTAASPTPVPAPPRDVIQLGTRPKGLNEVFVNYAGYRWRAAGMAIPLDETRLVQIGQYRGFAVYALREDEPRDRRRIFLPSRAGLVAPYERAGRPVYY